MIVIGRVIMGTSRSRSPALPSGSCSPSARPGGDGDWLLSPSAGIAPGRQQSPLLGYEKRLIDGLTDVGARSRLSALASEFGAALDDTREALVREAVH